MIPIAHIMFNPIQLDVDQVCEPMAKYLASCLQKHPSVEAIASRSKGRY